MLQTNGNVYIEVESESGPKIHPNWPDMKYLFVTYIGSCLAGAKPPAWLPHTLHTFTQQFVQAPGIIRLEPVEMESGSSEAILSLHFCDCS